MASVRARGVVIKQSDYGEGHRMLSIFTEEYGIIKAVSYGVKKSKGKSASSQFLNYGDFDLYKSSNRDILTINAIDTKDSFYPVSEDIKKLSLCVYFADITYELLGLGNPDDRLLHLFLNSVYALAYRSEDLMKVKTVYELKLMAAGGYAPHIGACMDCGEESAAFDFEKGGTVCASCRSKNSVMIDRNIYMALGYITGCDDKKMLMFRADDNLIEKLNAISEQYIRIQTDREFKSLDYFKDICKA